MLVCAQAACGRLQPMSVAQGRTWRGGKKATFKFSELCWWCHEVVIGGGWGQWCNAECFGHSTSQYLLGDVSAQDEAAVRTRKQKPTRPRASAGRCKQLRQAREPRCAPRKGSKRRSRPERAETLRRT
mmetsp:Transcript_10986/g.36083  ORF Transcript_10986/g.36083 Transcript_10986/m.36083 type:complete len:128 (-) Transcript_10986:860-1243(-)